MRIENTQESEGNGVGRPAGSAPSLRVFEGEQLLFSSSSHWLHPLFELETFLATSGLSIPGLRIEDKIIGKAAAFLIVRMGFRRVYGETMSRLALGVFEAAQVDFSFGRLVERIDCATEFLLADIDTAETAYSLIAERAAR